MKTFLVRYGDLLLTCALAAVFTFWPQIDLALAARFYQPGAGFPMAHTWWIKPFYYAVAHFWLFAFVWLFLLLIGFVPRFSAHWAPRRKMIAYLLLVLAIGPGLIANSALKNHWGRARPVQLAQFGGSAQFTPALLPSRQCVRNCAFVSGHAAAAFYPMVGFWLTRRRRWLVGGIVLGLFVGYIRMAMGGHFLSDVLFAWVVVHFTCRGLAHVFRLPIVAVPDKLKAPKPYPLASTAHPGIAVEAGTRTGTCRNTTGLPRRP